MTATTTTAVQHIKNRNCSKLFLLLFCNH